MYNPTKIKKVAVAVFFFTIATAAAIPSALGQLYPTTNIVFTCGILVMILLSWREDSLQQTYPVYLVVIVALSVAYRLRIFLFPASMIGMDPDGYAIQIARVMRTGETGVITFSFYSKAPLHILEGVMTGLLMGLPSPAASVVYPTVVGFLVPLLTVSFTRRLRPNSPRTVILAAGGASILGYTVQYSYWPIAQTTGVLFLLLTLFLIFVYASRGGRRWLGLAILTMVGAVYTHKLVAIAIALSVAGALALGRVHPASRETPAVKRLARSVLALVAVIVAVQLFYVTGVGRSVVFRLTTPSAPVSGAPMPTAAVDPYTLTDRLFRLSYVLLLAFMSGLVWLVWFRRTMRDRDRATDVLFLGLVAPLAGLAVLVYPTGVNPVRTIFYVEVLLVVLIAVGLYCDTTGSPSTSRAIFRYVAMAGMLSLIVTAGISPIAGPDYSSLSRDYLTAEEVSAKEWGYEMVPGEIAADQYYASETPPTRISERRASSSISSEKFNDRTLMYLNRDFQKGSPEVIAYRGCIDILRSEFGAWRLSYDAETDLENDYNRIYTSGCVSYFAS